MPGEPELPFKTVKILLPQGKDVLSVNVKTDKKIMLNGSFNIEPGQKPVPLTYGYETDKHPLEESPEILPYNTLLKNQQDRNQKNQTIYSSSKPFPGKLYDSIGVQVFRGYRILTLNLYPVQYIPKTGEIYYFKEMDITIETRNAESCELFRGLEKDEDAVRRSVDNPETTNTYRKKTKNVQRSSFVNPSDNYDYVIITNNALNNSNGSYTFQDLADFKNSHGIATTVVTVENILNESSYWETNPLFNDTQAVIRNFIIDAYLNWGIEYVLLGGDDEIIPHRGFYVDEGLYWDEDIPSDLYYACLDGSFNYDNDNYWGEINDGLNYDENDLFAEVYVGRAPVDSTDELSNFVFKTLSYEKSDDDYLRNVRMVGENLDWAVSGGDYKDEIRNGSSEYGYKTAGIPEEYNVSTLYDRDGVWQKSAVINVIKNGVHIINHIGHADVNSVMKMTNNDVKNLENNKYFFGYSQGCYAGSFDNRNSDGDYISDCIVEDFVTNSNGSFAFIANSRYGWGSYYDTNGPSQHFDREFFDALFGEDIRELGKANQDSKEDTIGFISDPVIRWCYYEINLFGDPTVRIKDAEKPEHDIEVRSIDAPSHGLPNETITVRAGIYNNGQNTENVTIELAVNNITVNSTTISNMINDTYQEACFNWTPNTNAVYDLCAYAEFVPNENVTDNNMANTTVIVGPDIAVNSISAPGYIEVNTTGIINATIINPGLINESNVTLDFIVNDAIIDNVSVSILSGTSVEVTFNWTAMTEGSYNIMIYAEPVADEYFATNNLLNKSILVVAIKGHINVAVVDSWGTDSHDSAVWDEINMHWYNYGDYVVSIDYISLNKENIIYSDIVNSGADVLMISDAWDSGIYNPNCNWEFTDDEINAINQYINDGHGLIGTGGTLCAYAPNNMKLASLFGLNPSSVGIWAGDFSQNFNLIYQENLLFTNIPNPYSTNIPWTVTGLTVTSGVKVANSTDNKAIIVEYNNVYASIYFTHIPEFIYRSNKYDRQIVYNSFVWAAMNYVRPFHDVAVTRFQTPAYLEIGKNAYINATIKNNGVSNENITVNLTLNNTTINTTTISLKKNSSQKIVFNWTSEVEGGYNIGIIASIPNENITTNNFAEKKIIVMRTPHVSFSPSYFIINITRVEAINKTLILCNNPDATELLHFDINAEPWISVLPENGTVNIGSQTNITLTINASMLSPGEYSPDIVINTNDFYKNQILIPLHLRIFNILPVADAGNDRYVNEKEGVMFNASASYDPDGNVTNYTWDFGDGKKGYEKIVNHSYAVYGEYTVTLKVEDNDFCFNSTTTSVFVNAVPTINIEENVKEIYTNENTTFGASAYDPDGWIVTYEWDFEDDGVFDSSSDKTGIACHTYTNSGVYTAIFRATDNKYAYTEGRVTVIVHNRAPNANIDANRTEVYTYEDIAFSASESTDADGEIINYTWNFGDSVMGYDENLTHSFKEDGNYTVTLNVTDNNGKTDITTKKIVVKNRPPVGSIILSGITVNTYENITFNSKSYDLDGSILIYIWDFGDGNMGTGFNITHAYCNSGAYTVILTIIDNDGAATIKTTNVTINNRPPTPFFIFSPESPTNPDVIEFTDVSDDPDDEIINWTWNFGDGNISYEQNPKHCYSNEGNYSVALTVTDNDGANSTITKQIQVFLDTDKDGVPDVTDPDDDNDGLTDEWENTYGLNPLDSNDANEDFDNDGLTNLEEYQHNTDPTNPDSDNDGLTDGDEVDIYGTEPLKSDTDGDGYNDKDDYYPLDSSEWKSNEKPAIIPGFNILVFICALCVCALILKRRKKRS